MIRAALCDFLFPHSPLGCDLEEKGGGECQGSPHSATGENAGDKIRPVLVSFSCFCFCSLENELGGEVVKPSLWSNSCL